MAMPERAGLTVGVTTRNRQQALLRCLSSLSLLGETLAEVIVVDDSSDVPVADSLAALPASGTKWPLRAVGGLGLTATCTPALPSGTTPHRSA